MIQNVQHIRRWRRWRHLAATVGILGALVACSAQPAAPTQEGAPGLQAGHEAHSQPAAKAAQPPPVTDVALQLQTLLGQHSVVAADMMRGRLRNDEDFAQSANTALGRNTDTLVQMVQTLFGEAAANQFRTLWTAHVTALFNYARGLANNDAALRDESKASLTAFERDLAGFFSDASQGRLPRPAAESAVLSHIEHLVGQADAYAARDYAKANKLYRDAYRHTFELGKNLANVLLPPDQLAPLQQPNWTLRSELSRLLGEHIALAVAATRAGVTNAPDFAAAAETVNANTADLTAAIDSLFGKQAADSFMSMWADHLDNVVAYTTGVVAEDAQKRNDAVAKLHGFEQRFAQFLETATSAKMNAADLARALAQHDQLLLQQVDAFAAKDYPKAHDIAYTTYQHMDEMAAALADAFGATVAQRLPTGGAETGLGGTYEGHR